MHETTHEFRAERGFSLIELLIAMTVLLIGLVSLLGLQQSSFRSSGFSRHATEASILGEDALERVMATSFDSVVSVAAQKVDETGAADANGLFTRTIDVVEKSSVDKLVTVTIAWSERGQAKSFEFLTEVSP